MRENQRLDLGSIQIHKHVIADIAANAIAEIKGLSLAQDGILDKIQEFIGVNKNPGVKVSVDKNNQVSVEIKVFIQYGLSIPDLASRAQEVVRVAIERAVDIDLKDVNINIRGIERGEQ
ncbi:MAG: Asp23/Gls24 family envelope stress response protein [Candidatus Omnitrophota bacterium]